MLEWVKRYDSEMEEKDKEITALRSIYEDERQQLAKLEDYFNKLMAEREAVAVEERTKVRSRHLPPIHGAAPRPPLPVRVPLPCCACTPVHHTSCGP